MSPVHAVAFFSRVSPASIESGIGDCSRSVYEYMNIWARSLSDIDFSTAANDPQPFYIVLDQEKSSPYIYSSEYASGFSRAAASYLTAPSSPGHKRQCRTGSY
jgi:hypothetical protein